MKRKIRCIYIEGMEKTGKTSMTREVCKLLEKQEKSYKKIKGCDKKTLDLQQNILKNSKDIIVKENALLSIFEKDLKEYLSIKKIEQKYSEEIRKEKQINQEYGCVSFLLIPESIEFVKKTFNFKEIPNEYMGLVSFYENIKLTSLGHGIDYRVIRLKTNDSIFDVKEKILYVLKNNYVF